MLCHAVMEVVSVSKRRAAAGACTMWLAIWAHTYSFYSRESSGAPTPIKGRLRSSEECNTAGYSSASVMAHGPHAVLNS